MKRIQLVTLLCTLLSTNINATTYKSVATGAWTSPDTWGTASYPSTGDSVIIDGHSITLDATDVTIQYLLITNEDDYGNSKLITSSNITLIVQGNLDIVSDRYDRELKLEVLTNSTLEVQGNLNVNRLLANQQGNKVQLKVHNSAHLKVRQNLIFDFDNTGCTIGNSNVNVHDFGVLEVGGNFVVQIEGGKKFDLHVHDGAKMMTGGNFWIYKNGGEEVYLHFHSDSISTIGANMTLQHYGGSGPFLTKVGDGNGNLQIGSHLTLESGSPNLLVTNDIIGVNALQKVGGDIVFVAQSADDVSINTSMSAHLMIGGSFSRPSYGKLDMEAGSKLTYNGTGAQTIASNNDYTTGGEAFRFGEVYFDNQSGLPMTLDDTLVVHDVLNLSNGLIHTDEDSPIILEDYATIVGGDVNAYIDGPVIKRGRSSGSFTFPLGHQNSYAPLELTEITNVNSLYRVEYINCPPPIGGYSPGIEQVSNYEFWDIYWEAGSTVVGFTLNWMDAIASGIYNTDSLVVVYNDGVNGWQSMGNMGISTGPGNRGSIVSNSINCPPPIGSFAMTFGSTNNVVNALPVELNYFKVYAENTKVAALEWETIAELAFSHFELERSSDGSRFEQIARVQATGGDPSQAQFYRSLDRYPFPGTNYYRLKLMDEDGMFVYSSIQSVNFSEEIKLKVAPNPVVDEITLSGLDRLASRGLVEITDGSAQVLYQNWHELESGVLSLDLKQLDITVMGTYFLSITDDKTRKKQTLPFIRQD
ncbi:MAG: hypothetical protein AAF985_11030 [Bacteroidota bacterium]